MKSFFRAINGILFIAALLAAAFCAYFAYSLNKFPADRYMTQIADTNAETERLQSQAAAALEESEERIDFLRADIRNNGEEAVALADKVDETRAAQDEMNERLEVIRAEVAFREDMPGTVESVRREYALKIRELEEKILRGDTDVRICYWTLDDGPTYITKNFLDGLDELGEHVHVTFFTANMANDSPDEEEMLRREMASGHSVQNHSYAHSTIAGGSVYRSLESLKEQIEMQDEWLYEVTGFHPTIFRFPGGSAWGFGLLPDAEEVIEELGYKWVDWNCNLWDAGAAENLPTADLEVYRALTQIPEEPIAMILGHDWNSNTLLAMKDAIPQLQEQGYVFLPLFPESVTMGMKATR